jgi:uncharacterized protein YbaR (Trm112 family)
MDIGSGDRPHPRANILLEKFVGDSSQRGGALVVEGRPLVVGDITALPFSDRSIDYIICSHVLEHMESSRHLEQALAELMRVGKRGYIETPSFIFEKLLGAPHHHWYVRKDGQRIIFTRKTKYKEYEDLMRVFLSLRKESKTFFRLLFEKFDVFFVSLEWDKKVEYCIENDLLDEQIENDYPADLAGIIHELDQRLEREHRLRMMLKRFIHRILARSVKVDLLQIIACPLCKVHVTLSQSGSEVICQKCDRAYPVRNGIPYMLPEVGTNGTICK